MFPAVGREAGSTLTTGPTRGEFHVYARQGIYEGDYSTGLILFDLSGNPLTLLRLNGPHPNRHVNRFPRRVTLPVAPHVHYLTERYQEEHLRRGGPAPDGYALLTTAYRELGGAMYALARSHHHDAP